MRRIVDRFDPDLVIVMLGENDHQSLQDVHGNWWNTGTPWVGVNWNFERRIALFPAAFSGDGQMSVNTRFADFPHYMPTEKFVDPESLFTGWMLLSYRKPVVASSARDSSNSGSGSSTTRPPSSRAASSPTRDTDA